MSGYLYDGALSPDTMRSIRDMMQSYPNPVEMSGVPVLDFLPVHHWVEEEVGGVEQHRSSRKYGIVWKNFSDQSRGMFLFLSTEAEKKMVLERCAQQVVNPEPFKSVI